MEEMQMLQRCFFYFQFKTCTYVNYGPAGRSIQKIPIRICSAFYDMGLWGHGRERHVTNNDVPIVSVLAAIAWDDVGANSSNCRVVPELIGVSIKILSGSNDALGDTWT
ncbi:hypothetical protein PsorP6_007377 [Peronosclerospora sorghi]|uniref:Uncharacterized protein n=1 Tax=Peronosclerospora sorghi TaxID=230839 RepID=A0ACC0W7U3_9STRA|nr:hypothetical protein PsorP6_007377 [Peronosclerospora sorghi]